jgi:NADH:ubiquinone oxidoreductase subunit 5 (subunit L)/multisubunit Na+/H+ antiporter MnhA subunit
VGVCSYLLISFWFTRVQANKAAIKAMIVNRISDVALTLGIIATFCLFRSTDFPVIFALAPFFLNQDVVFFGFEANVLTVVTLLMTVGAMGKSAQIFLHT